MQVERRMKVDLQRMMDVACLEKSRRMLDKVLVISKDSEKGRSGFGKGLMIEG